MPVFTYNTTERWMPKEGDHNPSDRLKVSSERQTTWHVLEQLTPTLVRTMNDRGVVLPTSEVIVIPELRVGRTIGDVPDLWIRLNIPREWIDHQFLIRDCVNDEIRSALRGLRLTPVMTPSFDLEVFLVDAHGRSTDNHLMAVNYW